MEPDHPYEDISRKRKIENMPRASSILDVGCGSGKVWQHYPYDAEIDGVEPNDILRGKAEDSGVFDNLFRSPDNIDIEKYDIVTIMGVLEHVDNDYEFLMSFAKANSLYLTVPNGDSFHRYMGIAMGLNSTLAELGPSDFAVGHQRVYSYNNFLNLVLKTCSWQTSIYSDYIGDFGTLGFKIGTSDDMWAMVEECPQREQALYNTARSLGLAGSRCKYGAELYSYTERWNYA